MIHQYPGLRLKYRNENLNAQLCFVFFLLEKISSIQTPDLAKLNNISSITTRFLKKKNIQLKLLQSMYYYR